MLRRSFAVAVIVILTGLLSACWPEQQQNDLEVFIVVGAGNGIPMSGRSVYFFDDSLISEISRLQSSYDDDLNKLYKDAIEGNPAVKKELQQMETSLANAINRYQQQQVQYKKRVAGIDKKVDQEVSKRSRKYRKKLSLLNKRQQWLKTVGAEFTTRTKKFSDKIVILQKKIDKLNAIDADSKKKIIKIYNDYIIKHELPNDLITEEYIYVSSGDYSDIGYYYSILNKYSSPDADKYINLGCKYLKPEIARKVASSIDPLMSDAYRAKTYLGNLNLEKAVEVKKRNNAIISLERKYGSDLTKKFNSYDPDFEQQLIASKKYLTSEIKRTNAKLKKVASKASRETIKQDLLKDLKKTSENMAYLIAELAELPDAYKKEIVNAGLTVLNQTYSTKLLTRLLSKKMVESITDLGGKVSIPEKAKFAFLQASRLSDESYIWLVPVNEKPGKQILTNQNISHDGNSVGVWIFDTFSEEIDRFNQQNNK